MSDEDASRDDSFFELGNRLVLSAHWIYLSDLADGNIYGTPHLVLQSIGLFFLIPAISVQHPPNSWIEAHAALSLVAFGAFGLACISALMFLFQEWQLKSQAPSLFFHFLLQCDC